MALSSFSGERRKEVGVHKSRFMSTCDQKLRWRYYNGKSPEAMDGLSGGLFCRKASKKKEGEKNVSIMSSIGREAGKWKKRLDISIRTQ